MAGAETTAAAAEPTLADGLALSRPHLSKELVDDESFDRLLQMGRHFPDDVMAAIELRLAPGKAPADLSVRLATPRRADDIALQLPSAGRRLHRLLADPGIHSLWLEFDSDRTPPEGLPEPVVCARLQRDLRADDVLDVLTPITSLQRQLLGDAWNRCPQPAEPLYLFDLQARGRPAVRLDIYGECLEDLVDWLFRIDHPAARRLDDRVFALQPADRFHVSCDAGPDGWLDTVGIEGSFRRWPHKEPGWRRMFAALSDRELCMPSKERAVWEWPGYESVPGGFRVRALSHVKISVPSDAPPCRAKVYFLLQRLENLPA